MHESAMSVDQWRKRAQRNDLPDMPQTGKVHTVTIPNTKSNFAARPAMIVCRRRAKETPDALPAGMLAGQPGTEPPYH